MHDELLCILLSTFNGEQYLRMQLDSILAQTYKNICLIARDDGSCDGTAGILGEYASQHVPITSYCGSNIGVVRSYMELLRRVPDDAQYVAFCDQDDYWQPEKLERGLKNLCEIDTNIPAMYCTRLDVTDNQLRHMYFSWAPRRGLTFKSALVENVATGCTVIMNRAGLQLLKRDADFNNVIMHDWWAYLVISAFGAVVFDDYVSVKYRQHGRNVVGSRRGFAIWRKRWDAFQHNSQQMIGRQTAEFMRVYGPLLSGPYRRMVQNFIIGISSPKWSVRARYAASTCVHRQTLLDTFAMKTLIVLGKYKAVQEGGRGVRGR